MLPGQPGSPPPPSFTADGFGPPAPGRQFPAPPFAAPLFPGSPAANPFAGPAPQPPPGAAPPELAQPFAPGGIGPGRFPPNRYDSPGQFGQSQFSQSQFSPSQFSPSQFEPGQASPGPPVPGRPGPGQASQGPPIPGQPDAAPTGAPPSNPAAPYGSRPSFSAAPGADVPAHGRSLGGDPGSDPAYGIPRPPNPLAQTQSLPQRPLRPPPSFQQQPLPHPRLQPETQHAQGNQHPYFQPHTKPDPQQPLFDAYQRQPSYPPVPRPPRPPVPRPTPVVAPPPRPRPPEPAVPPAVITPAASLELARLRALARFTKSLAGVQSTQDVVAVAAAEAHRVLDASAVSISVWQRDTGMLRVLVNHGALAPDESERPERETYPVSEFPTVLLSEDDLGPWVQLAETGSGDPRRVDQLRRRGRYCALIAPIVFGGRAWGELYAARTAEQPVYNESDLDYAEALSAQIAAGLARAGEMERIEQLAYTDQLTGLANRRAFDTRLDAAMDRHNSDGTVVSLVLCDGNGLKRINDQHGHDHGDALLVELGACVSAAASRLPRSLAARLGGDEFCLLIEGYTADDAVSAAEDLCLRALTVRGGEGMSCGVASTGDPIGRVATRDGLIRLADAAQYRAKRSRSLSPVVAGRGQPPDPELPQQNRGVPVAASRGRASAPVEALLGQALAGLDKLPPGAEGIDRVELVTDQVARGLDAASWFIYRRSAGRGALYQERSAVYRAASESTGSFTLPAGGPAIGGGRPEILPTSPPQWIEPLPNIADQLRGGGTVTLAVGQDANWNPGDLGISPEFLAAAGYTSALSAGATATDGSQWLVAVLLDEISLWAQPALPLLRVLLAGALAIT